MRFILIIIILLKTLRRTPILFPYTTLFRSAIDQKFNRRYDAAIESVERQALERNIMLYRDNGNLAFTPIREGRGLEEAEFAQLHEAERERYHTDIAELEDLLSEALSSLPQWKRESSNELRELNEQTITEALN